MWNRSASPPCLPLLRSRSSRPHRRLYRILLTLVQRLGRHLEALLGGGASCSSSTCLRLIARRRRRAGSGFQRGRDLLCQPFRRTYVRWSDDREFSSPLQAQDRREKRVEADSFYSSRRVVLKDLLPLRLHPLLRTRPTSRLRSYCREDHLEGRGATPALEGRWEFEEREGEEFVGLVDLGVNDVRLGWT